MPAGRPTVMTAKILERLRQAFAIGCTDEEACAFADIAPRTFYDYQKANPEFLQEKEALKQKPILKAKKTIEQSLDDPKNAQWYLERKKKDEFSTRNELTGKNGEDLLPKPIFSGQSKDVQANNSN